MADTKFFADGNVDIWVIRQNQLTDPTAPLLTELTANAINLSNAIAWDGTTWPNVTDSNDSDDRSIKDYGNATTRGYAQFEATLNFFFPKLLSDVTSDYGKAYQFFRTASGNIPVYLITRIGQGTPNTITPLAAGQVISVFSMLSDAFTTDTEGDDSYKYSVNFLSQSTIALKTQVVTASKSTITISAPAGNPTTVGQKKAFRAVLNGHRITNQALWASSNLTVATVSQNGVVAAVATGSANITASHPAGTISTATALTIA